MPEMRKYKVIQVREVLVAANSATSAALIAEAAFEHGQDSSGGVRKDKAPAGIWGNTYTPIREVALDTKEVRVGER